MKTALITPIIKDAKGNAYDLNNYRLVSQLQIFSKIIEHYQSTNNSLPDKK